MKLKIIKYALISMLFFMAIFTTKEVKAEEYTGQAIWISEYVDGVYVRMNRPDGSMRYIQSVFLRRSEDNQFVYCLQPFADIDNSLPYYNVIRSDYANILGLSKEQWERISLLAYYGYQYNDNGYNHSDPKWYAITQVMIWRITNPNDDIYFTDYLNGNRVPYFEAEMAELNSLVDTHYVKPNINNNITMPIGSTIELTDTNGVLNKYKISGSSNVTSSIDGNSLFITANNVGVGNVSLEMKATKYDLPPIVYISSHSQSVFRVGQLDPAFFNLNINIIGGRVSITKKDSCGNVPSDASLEGAIYGIYDFNGNKVTEITTNVNGEATSDYLPGLGKYYAQEIKASNNYLLDKTKYEFTLTEENTKDNIPVHIDVKENRKAKIELEKVDYDQNTAQGEATLEGAIYEIYDASGNKVGSMTTDANGKAISNYLPGTGKYVVKEVKASNGYNIDSESYIINVTEENTCNNYKVKSQERVITNTYEYTKVLASNETMIMIPEIGVKFGIFDSNNNLVNELTTNIQGVFKFTLPYGTYTVKQLTTTPGYEKINDFNIEVKEQLDDIKKVISNAPITTKLRVVKIDAETKEVIKRANIKFKIFDVNKNEYVCQKITYPTMKEVCVWETDSNGEFTTAYPLIIGTYRLEEVDQAIDGYLWNNESHEFTIDEKSNLRTDSEYGIIFDTDFENTRVKGEIQIEKVGEVATITDDGFEFNNISLKGVKFGLYALEDIILNNNIIYTKDSLIGEGITDIEGRITFKDLYLGKYYVKELETLDNYILDENKYEVELLYKDQYTPTVVYSNSLLNVLKTGTLEFSKIDFSTEEPLPNTLIEIYTEADELIFSGRTDSEGKIKIDRLPQGKYYILEKEAPEGYEINPEKMRFEIKENGEVVKSIMKDKQIIKVPDTEASDLKEILINGIALVLFGIGVILYGTKKSKK